MNALAAGYKLLLGMDQGCFGIANKLAPHPGDLVPRRVWGDAVDEIIELTPAPWLSGHETQQPHQDAS